MPTHSSTDVTRLLRDWSRGDESAFEALVPVVYDELHRLARRFMRHERSDHTLQTTGLVHEAYLKLVGARGVQWEGRSHFLAVASQVMRRILVTHARKRAAGKRGGPGLRLSIDAGSEGGVAAAERSVDLVALDDALRLLADTDQAQSRLVELRFFGGLTTEEAAAVMGVSPTTAKRKWLVAKAWLHRELKGGAETR